MTPIADGFESTGLTAREIGERRDKHTFSEKIGGVVLGEIEKDGATPFLDRAKRVYPNSEVVARLRWEGVTYGDNGQSRHNGRLVEITQPNRSGGEEKIALPMMEDSKSRENYVIAPDGSVHRLLQGSNGWKVENVSITASGVSRWQFDPRLADIDHITINGDGEKDATHDLPGGGKVRMQLTAITRYDIGDAVNAGELLINTLATRSKLVTGEMV